MVLSIHIRYTENKRNNDNKLSLEIYLFTTPISLSNSQSSIFSRRSFCIFSFFFENRRATPNDKKCPEAVSLQRDFIEFMTNRSCTMSTALIVRLVTSYAKRLFH